jgi:LysM repeat protein
MAILVILVSAVSGQELVTHGASPNLYVIHKVAAKETWYSIGRTFNLTPKEIATYNNLSIEKPLEIGASVKVPLTKSNFSQEDPSGSVDDLVPIYHIVQDKEWMYRISINHNKVPIEKIERWNNISRDDAKAGTKLIVGFLSSANAGAANASAPVAVQKPAAAPTQPTTPPATASTKPPVATTAGGTQAVEGGYFKSQFDQNGKNQKGFSGIFKSTSGWKDGKYYALMNNVTVGTIVKVNYPSTNKSIYAKVLGELPDMKESAGLSLRISDAAAKELGAVNNKFDVQVMY